MRNGSCPLSILITNLSNSSSLPFCCSSFTCSSSDIIFYLTGYRALIKLLLRRTACTERSEVFIFQFITPHFHFQPLFDLVKMQKYICRMDKQQVIFRDLGNMEYKEAWDYQEKLLQENVRKKSLVKSRESIVMSGAANNNDSELTTHNSRLTTEHYL